MKPKVSAAKSSHTSEAAQVLLDLARRHKYWGIYTRVARHLGVTPQTVQKVALGVRKSNRVLSALLAQIRKEQEREQRKAA